MVGLGYFIVVCVIAIAHVIVSRIMFNRQIKKRDNIIAELFSKNEQFKRMLKEKMKCEREK